MGEPQKIIVDGYNVIYADDSLRPIAIKDMERARRGFIEKIESYLFDKQLQVTVVFDGRGGIVDAEAIVPGKLQVVYSAQQQTADDLIISIVAESGNPSSYLVVTSDKTHIRPAVSELGCRVIGSRSFVERLSERRTKEPRNTKEEKPRPESVETDYWLDQFGEGKPSDGDV